MYSARIIKLFYANSIYESRIVWTPQNAWLDVVNVALLIRKIFTTITLVEKIYESYNKVFLKYCWCSWFIIYLQFSVVYAAVVKLIACVGHWHGDTVVVVTLLARSSIGASGWLMSYKNSGIIGTTTKYKLLHNSLIMTTAAKEQVNYISSVLTLKSHYLIQLVYDVIARNLTS